MINKTKSWLWNNISSDLPADYDLDVLRKIFLLNLIFILGSLFLILLGIIAFIQENFALGIADFTIFSFLVCLFFYLRNTKRVNFVSIIGTVAVGIFYFFLIAQGGTDNTAYVWFFTYPLISIFLLGVRLGTFMSVLLLGIAGIVFAFGPRVSFFTSYSNNLIIRVISAYIAINLFALVMEKVREMIQNKLNISNIELAHEIEERKQSAKDLKESEEKYRLLVENIPSVTWLTSEHGKSTFISPNVEKIYGFSQEEIYEAGESVWFGRIHPDDAELVRDSFEKMFSKKQKFDFQYRIQKKDGEWIWIHDTAIMAFEKDDIRYAYGVFSDITERKEMEEEREELIIELKGAFSKINTLKGFLPICASCKKIRDDKGYWNQIEAYIRDHSEAEFSHSICPECAKKLYPNLKLNKDE